MITGIVLENFKCFEKVEIHPKRVTCFVGANGTGKSSVLQAFGLLKQTNAEINSDPETHTERELFLQGPLVNVKGVRDLNHNFRRRPLLNINGSYSVSDEEHLFSYVALLSREHINIQDQYVHDIKYFYYLLSELHIIPAIRGLTRPVYRLGDDTSFDVAMEEGFSQQEAQTATNLGYSQSVIQSISPLLKRITGVGLQVVTVPPQSVEVKSVTDSNSFNIVTEGFGTNSLIMLLLQLTSAEEGATVMIEEPEIHLHPKAQAELAEVLTEVALEEDKQVIMTTHSEHITGRLLTLVAEGKLTPDDVAIYAFAKDEEGVCTAKDLKINPEGTIEGSINDFFEVSLAEMNRVVKALSARANQAG